MFDIVVKDMNIAKEKAKCMLIQKYSQEKIKHQFVIKELGLLRLLTQDYLQSLNKKSTTKYGRHSISDYKIKQ